MLVFAAMMLSAGIELEQLADRLVALGLGLLLLVFAFWAVFDSLLHLIGAVKVVTGDRSLTIQNTFTKHHIRWEEITEFGTYKRIAHYQYIRVYYVKAYRYGDRKIRVCGDSLQNLNELIETVFQKARNARFVWIENHAVIPFTRHMVTLPWKRETRNRS